MDPLDDPFLTVAEVATLLKLNQQTVRNWIDQGSLPALRVGRRVRIRRSDFERLLEQGEIGGGAGANRGSGPSAEEFWGGGQWAIAEPVVPREEQGPGGRSTDAERGAGDGEAGPVPGARPAPSNGSSR